MPHALQHPSKAALALLLLAQCSAAGDRPSVAVLTFRGPEELRGNYAAYFATFSGWPLPKGDLILRAPHKALGCDPYPKKWAKLGLSPGFVSVVRRGVCTFIQKAQMAQDAGALGIIIVSDNETVQIMGAGNTSSSEPAVDIFVVGVDRELGDRMRNASVAAAREGTEPPMMAISAYQSSLLNISEGILICFATLLVALGAFFSTSDLDIHPTGSFSTALAAPQEEVLEVDPATALGFCVVGSGFLVFLFFFMHYMIYVIIFAFCLGGASCLTQFGSICLTHQFPSLKAKVSFPVIGPVAHADILAGIPAVIVVTSWLVLRNTRHGWPFQDAIGAGFLCWMQRTLRLPNIKVATILLCVMFFFDIFWVFISPIFFHESVMVSVATGGGTGESVPMLLRLPAVGDPFGNDRLLGFGDIALPGLLVSYLRRHDLQSERAWRSGYFAPALVGYFVGLNVTIAALCIMKMGQPALLYLVPGTLGTTLVLASSRGELGLLWEGLPARAGQPAVCSVENNSGSEYKHPPL